MDFITQSCYKDWLSYKRGNLCGLKFKSRWIDKQYESTQTEKQKAGWWFEDMLIRRESEYEPTLIKSGQPNALFRQLQDHLPIATQMLRNAGNVVSSNEDVFKGSVKAKRDLVIEKNGKYKIVDIKTTAHLSNKFDFYGWGALTETSTEKSNRFHSQFNDKLIQALTYLYVDTDVKAESFEWWIFSTSSDEMLRIGINAKDYRQRIDQMGDDLEDAFIAIQQEEFEPYPDYRECRFCPLKNSCEYSEKLPQTIYL